MVFFIMPYKNQDVISKSEPPYRQERGAPKEIMIAAKAASRAEAPNHGNMIWAHPNLIKVMPF